MQLYKPKYFPEKECFPPGMTPNWNLMDDRILISADQLREIFGPLTCNISGFTQCGYRTNGSLTSQHRHGRAMDLHSTIHPYYKMREYILNHPEKFPFITFLEVDINWLHIDCRNNYGEIKIWSPKRGFLSKQEYLKR